MQALRLLPVLLIAACSLEASGSDVSPLVAASDAGEGPGEIDDDRGCEGDSGETGCAAAHDAGSATGGMPERDAGDPCRASGRGCDTADGGVPGGTDGDDGSGSSNPGPNEPPDCDGPLGAGDDCPEPPIDACAGKGRKCPNKLPKLSLVGPSSATVRASALSLQVESEGNGSVITRVALFLDGQRVRDELFYPYRWGSGGPFPLEFRAISAGDHVFVAEAFGFGGVSRKATLELTIAP